MHFKGYQSMPPEHGRMELRHRRASPGRSAVSMSQEPARAFTPRAMIGLTSLAILAFVSLGLPDGVLGVAWPSMRGALGLGMAELGGLLAAAMLGYLVSAAASGTLVARLGVGRLLLASSLVMTASSLAYALAPGRALALGAALLAGLGGGAIDAGINAYAARRFSPRLVTWLHACYGVGAMLGPLLITGVIAVGWSWRVGYGLLATALGAMALAFAATRSAWDAPGDGLEAAPLAPQAPAATLGETLARPRVWLNLVLFFLYTGLEVTAAQWAYSLFTEARGVDMRPAGLAVSAYWASLSVGRVLVGALAPRHSPEQLLRVSLILAPVGGVMLWWAPQPLLGLLGLAMLGLAFAPIYPLLIAITPERLGHRYVTQAVGLQVAVAYLGTAALPGLGGVLAATAGLEVIPPLLLGGCLALILLHEGAARHDRPVSRLLAAPARGNRAPGT
jgi:fucose permease